MKCTVTLNLEEAKEIIRKHLGCSDNWEFDLVIDGSKQVSGEDLQANDAWNRVPPGWNNGVPSVRVGAYSN